MRTQLIRDFNDVLHDSLEDGPQRPLLIFIFSDPKENIRSFLPKIFSKQVLDSPKTGKLMLNPVTEKSIGQVLESIAASQGIDETHLSRQRLTEIRDTCNRDLRNAIQTLQFSAAGKTIKHLN